MQKATLQRFKTGQIHGTPHKDRQEHKVIYNHKAMGTPGLGRRQEQDTGEHEIKRAGLGWGQGGVRVGSGRGQGGDQGQTQDTG